MSLPGYSDNIIAEMKAADLYVLSSRFEGSPNAIVEAMSVGTQVVAFDCPHGAREILQDGNVAPLVEYKNIDLIAHAMTLELEKQTSSKRNTDIVRSVQRFTSQNSPHQYRLFYFWDPLVLF